MSNITRSGCCSAAFCTASRPSTASSNMCSPSLARRAARTTCRHCSKSSTRSTETLDPFTTSVSPSIPEPTLLRLVSDRNRAQAATNRDKTISVRGEISVRNTVESVRKVVDSSKQERLGVGKAARLLAPPPLDSQIFQNGTASN